MNYAEKNGVTPEMLRMFLEYSPATGRFFYKPRDRSFFPDNRSFKIFKSRFAGKECFCTLGGNGYLHGCINNVLVYSHLAAYAISFGKWPDGILDHINGDRLDNRIENLRVVSSLGNSCNRAKSTGKTSRFIGVSWSKSKRKWRAYINSSHNKTVHIGYFSSEEDAAAARLKAQRECSQFHENHGKRMSK